MWSLAWHLLVLTFALDEQWNQFGSSGDGQFVVAISARNGIYVSNDFGVSWMHRQRMEVCMWPCRHGSMAISQDGKQMVVVSGSNDRLYRSADHGLTWTAERHGEAEELPAFRAAAAAKDGSVVFAGTSGGLWRSNDAGESWMELSGTNTQWWGLTTSADGQKIAGISRANYHCTCCGCGSIWVSLDAGNSWTKAAPDGSFWGITATSDFSHLWVATRRTLDTASVWMSSDSGSQWTERLVSSSHAAAQLGIAGSADGRVLAMVFEELGYYPGWLYLSFDLGLSWTASGFDGTWGCKHVAVSEDGGWMVTGGVFGPPFVSWDLGQSWTAGVVGSTTTTMTQTVRTTLSTTEVQVPSNASNHSNGTTTTTTATTSYTTSVTHSTTDVGSTSTSSTTTADDEDASDAVRRCLFLVLVFIAPFSLSL